MEKKASNSPAGKASTGTVVSPAGKASTGTVVSPAGKASTGTVVSPAGKASTGTVVSPAGKASTGTVVSPAGKMPTGTVVSPASNTPIAPLAAAPVSPNVNWPMTTLPANQSNVKHDMKKWCHDHMYRYMLVHTHDGWCCDGFMEHMDDEVLCIAVPHCDEKHRAFVPGPFYPRRRFYRQVFPLRTVAGLSLLPFY